MSYRRPPGRAPGVGLAALLAGPLFIVMVLLGTYLAEPVAIDPGAMPDRIGLELLASAVTLAIVTPFGAVLAVVPCLIGGALMKRLARNNVGLRLPVAWGLAGASLAGGGAAALDAPGSLVFAFAATGAFCALLCRRGCVWP